MENVTDSDYGHCGNAMCSCWAQTQKQLCIKKFISKW